MMPKMVYDKLGERRREEVDETGDSVGRKKGGIGLRLCFFSANSVGWLFQTCRNFG